MVNFVTFQAQLASIMDVLAKAAVIEITKLVEDSSAGIRLEISRSQFENVALRRKLNRMESELVLTRRYRETQGMEKSSVIGPGLRSLIQTRNGVEEDGHDSSVFGVGWGGRQWNDGEVRVVEDDILTKPLTLTDESMDMETGVSSSLTIEDTRGLASGGTKEGLVISEERLDVCSREMRRPREQPHREAYPENAGPQPIPTEHLEEVTGLQKYRSSDKEELEVKDVGERAPPMRVPRSERDVKPQNSPGGEHMFERSSLQRTPPLPAYHDLEAEDQGCANVSGDQQRLVVQAEPHGVQTAQGSSNSTPSLGSLDVKLHIGTSSLACVKEEAEIQTICIEEPASERVQQHDGETLNCVKSEGQAFQTRPQRFKASGEGMSQSIAESGSETEDPPVFQMTNSLEPHQITDTGELASTHLPPSLTHLNGLRDLIRPGTKAFRCTQCGRTFSHRNYLYSHQRIHTGEKPFVCVHCGKSFTQRGHLTDHKRIHTGERPFSCAVCGSSFTQQSNLRRHQRIHMGKRPYS